MRYFSKLKYPKITLIVISIIFAYLLFSNVPANLINLIDKNQYLSQLIGGILFSFGFTTPFGIGILLFSSPGNIVLASLIGGLGAMISDLLIFKIVKISLMDEFNRLKNNKIIIKTNELIEVNTSYRIRYYLLYALSGLIIASPLPDELGISLLAGLTHIKTRMLIIISFIMNTLGIFIILSL